jgi:hypothetical protein
MRRIVVTSFLLSAVGTATIAYPSLSDAAFWSRHSAAECNTVAGGADNYVDGGNNLSANSMILYCATQDTSAAPRQWVNWVNVHVQDNTTSWGITSHRCVKFTSATGGACGSGTSTGASFTGQQLLNPPTFAQWGNGEFGYIYVLLPARGTGTSSKLNGYSMGD